MMNTIINPIEGEYDLDSGVYLMHLSDVEEAKRNIPVKEYF
ncbi:hypothetical protein P9265_22215 [Schinkia azotoformans]|nr:hypothetical protein [Schinkia azotoformans]